MPVMPQAGLWLRERARMASVASPDWGSAERLA
jgi:hypothetical protein